MYEHAREIAESLQDIRRVEAATRGDLTGTLRLGLFTTLSPWLFPPIAEHFDRAFPDVDLVEGGSTQPSCTRTT
ncbi:LysR family transcriptional regulator [Krasilnikoviella flava]|uniref:LysR substrate binding domain-containing protein n=1 Tax=Krasilnikoviella flava TaxID=526729 RepID=A0A1T5L687_9MICO|nr:LysR family transcriptional regulator [Krasilnikoviella flava]SKC71235.1 LysR substrate binding domain-containing protein [Krasilnikoviella flava]